MRLQYKEAATTKTAYGGDGYGEDDLWRRWLWRSEREMAKLAKVRVTRKVKKSSVRPWNKLIECAVESSHEQGDQSNCANHEGMLTGWLYLATWAD